MADVNANAALNGGFIPALTGTRFFAAVAIILWHSQVQFFAPGTFWPLDLEGGVAFFFVLSGFVLTINASKYRSWWRFFVARIARIWPAHLAAIAFLVFIFWPYSKTVYWDDPKQFPIIIFNIFLLQGWVPEREVYWSLNAPSWSLSSELAFYAAFPVLLRLMRYRPLLVLLILTTGFLAAQVLIWKLAPTIDSDWLGHYAPFAGLPMFALGVASAQWFLSHQLAKRDQTALQFGTLAILIVFNVIFKAIPSGFMPEPVAIFCVKSGAAPAYALFILALAYTDGAISRVLARPTLVFLGEISFSIYLFHQLIIRWHADNLSTFVGLPLWLQYVGVLAASFVISSLCYLIIEKPCRHAILQLLKISLHAK